MYKKRLHLSIIIFIILAASVIVTCSTVSHGKPVVSLNEWFILGPFDNPPGDAGIFRTCVNFENDILASAGGEAYLRPDSQSGIQGKSWKPVQADNGYVDLLAHFPRIEHCIVYAYTEFDSDTEQKAVLKTGSDDALKIWFNGKNVLSRHVHRALIKDDDAVSIDLKKGKNTLLLKIGQVSGGFGFAVRTCRPEDEEKEFASLPPKEIRIDTDSSVILPGGIVRCTVATNPAFAVHEPVTISFYDIHRTLLEEKQAVTAEEIEFRVPDSANGVITIECTGMGRLAGTHTEKIIYAGTKDIMIKDALDFALETGDILNSRQNDIDDIGTTLLYYAQMIQGFADPIIHSGDNGMELIGTIEELRNGGIPDRPGALRGVRQKAYRSGQDNTLQPYSLYIPESYDENKKYSLIVALHGMYAGDYKLAAQLALQQPQDFIIVAPFARGNSDYINAGEKEVLDVTERIISSYAIDPDRVYITGHSMGGYGTTRFALCFTDRFAAAASFAGFWNYHEYLAPNLHHLPMLFVHGEIDTVVPFYKNQAGLTTLTALKYPVTVDKLPGVGHQCYEVWVREKGPARLLDYFRQFSRIEWPETLTFITNNAGYGKHYWINISELADTSKRASLEARIAGGNIVISMNNVKTISLDTDHPALAKGTISVSFNNGKITTESGKGWVAFSADADGSWSVQ